MDREKPANPKERAHERLDQLLEQALRERLWGEVLIKVKIEDGEIKRVAFAPDLGEKF